MASLLAYEDAMYEKEFQDNLETPEQVRAKWPRDSERSRLKERKKGNNRFSKLLTENSKWKLMTSEKKKLNS